MRKKKSSKARRGSLQREEDSSNSFSSWIRVIPKLQKGLARFYNAEYFLRNSIRDIREAMKTGTYRQREKELIQEFERAAKKSKLNKDTIFLNYLFPELKKFGKEWAKELKEIDKTLLRIEELRTKTSLINRNKAS